MKFKVNPRLVPIKTHFFLNFAGLSPILPFLPVFAKQIGFDEVNSLEFEMLLDKSLINAVDVSNSYQKMKTEELSLSYHLFVCIL